MSAIAEKIAGRENKFNTLLAQMAPGDRRYVERLKVTNDNEDGVTFQVRLYAKLISQNLLDFITTFSDRHKGSVRMYPEDSLVCIEITVINPWSERVLPGSVWA